MPVTRWPSPGRRTTWPEAGRRGSSPCRPGPVVTCWRRSRPSPRPSRACAPAATSSTRWAAPSCWPTSAVRLDGRARPRALRPCDAPGQDLGAPVSSSGRAARRAGRARPRGGPTGHGPRPPRGGVGPHGADALHREPLPALRRRRAVGRGRRPGGRPAAPGAGRRAAPPGVLPGTPITSTPRPLQLSVGDLSGVERWAVERDVSDTVPPDFLREYDHLTLVRLLLAQQRAHRERDAADRALGLLERLGRRPPPPDERAAWWRSACSPPLPTTRRDSEQRRWAPWPTH